MQLKRLSNYKYAAILIAACLLVLGIIRFCPKAPLLEEYSFSKSFFAQDGQLLHLKVSYDDKYRTFVPLRDMPETFRNAVLLYEDRYFYYHPGFNPISLLNGFVTTFIKKTRRTGASTITMQTARILYHLNSKTIGGKLKQMLYAVWLEMRYSKKEILEAYLNLAPYGYNIEGAPAAALTYFKRRIEDINLVQALTLAVIPQNPNQRHPDTPAGYRQMEISRQRLFQNWLHRYPQDKEQQPFFDLPLPVFGPKNRPFLAPHLVNYLDARVQKNEVFSSLDLPLQTLYEQSIRSYINRKAKNGFSNATAVLIDTRSMQVRTLVGSADFYNKEIAGQVNGVIAQRMAGSVLKSFLFGMALDKGLLHPMTLLRDTPQYFGIYAPENSDRQFIGPVFAQDALVRSRNIPAMELSVTLGIQNFIDFLKRGGVAKLQSAEHYGISAAIGSLGISPLECARLYAMIANYGKARPVSFSPEAADNSGEQLLSPEAAFILFEMLSTNPPPLNAPRIFDSHGNPVKVAWKTGTSYSFKDAWAAGIFGDYVLVVWVGNFSGVGNPHFWGRTAAGELFFELISLTVRHKPNESFTPMLSTGLNVKKVPVCAPTGDLPGRFCPQTTLSWFIPGVSPLKISSVHRQIAIDKKTGLRACRYKAGETEMKVYEFWPKEILALFEKAGINKKSIPRYMPGCDIEETAHQGFAPEITLPTPNILYYADDEKGTASIPLKANADADAKNLFWFADGIFVGSTTSNAGLVTPLGQGTHQVQVADDLGRSNSVEIQVVLDK